MTAPQDPERLIPASVLGELAKDWDQAGDVRSANPVGRLVLRRCARQVRALAGIPEPQAQEGQ